MKAQIGDIEIFYRWDGPENGPVVLMLHAMATSHRVFDRQLPALTDRYRVLRYDWRGHGGTDAPAGAYSFAQHVRDAVGLLDHLGLRQVLLVGLSAGGMIAQGLTLAHPHRVAALVLCNTIARAAPAFGQYIAERQQQVRLTGMTPLWDSTANHWFSPGFTTAQSPDYMLIRDIFCRTSPDGYIGGTSAVVHLDYLDDLHRLTVPTLVMGVGDDPVTPPAALAAIAERIPGAQSNMLSGLRHLSNVEAPDRFNPPLRHFLDAAVAKA